MIGETAAYKDPYDAFHVFHGGGKGLLSPHRTYGSALPSVTQPRSGFSVGRRRRLNAVAIIISILLPWFMFSFVHWLMSGRLRFTTPAVMWTLWWICIATVVSVGVLSFYHLRMKAEGVPDRVQTWYTFLFLSLLFAFILGQVTGSSNYEECSKPYYQWKLMNTFDDVDPGKVPGMQLMDVGRLSFTKNATVDLTKAMTFKDDQTYCVAPITNGVPATGQYDFWAVDTGCCDNDQAHVWCEDWKNPYASGGLRSLKDSNRPFYRLAVQQAEAFYNIRAEHPLFFEWVVDKQEDLEEYLHDHYRRVIFWISAYFVFQCFLVAVTTVAFTKLPYVKDESPY